MGEPADPTRLLDGRLLVRQSATGHRAGTDAVLLAGSVVPQPGSFIIDIGSGVGTVGLALGVREPSARIALIEIEPDLVGLARENACLNGMQDRVAVEQFDLFQRDAGTTLHGRGDLVVSNPPYYLAREARPSPDAVRSRAHRLGPTNDRAAHGDWLHAMLRFVRPGGTLALIHRPEALPDLLSAAAGRLGHLRIRSIQPRADDAAIRILFGGVAGSRAPFGILSPIILHGDNGFTPLAEALHRGNAVLPLVPTKKSRPRGPASA